LEDQFTSGDGTAYGVEFFLNKQIGDFTGWIGYTIAWTERTFSELNQGKSYPPRYDRRHDISLVLSYKFNKKWSVGSSWVYGTGQAYTMPTGVFYFGDNPDYRYDEFRYNYTDRNGFRLPAFHKLDLTFNRHSTFFGKPSIWSFSLYNAYNRKNPFAWYLERDFDDSGRMKVYQLTLFPIIPSIGYSVKF
jgi:hypothetical protein